MTEQEIRSVVAAVVARYCAGTDSGAESLDDPRKIHAEASARHVHLTHEAVQALFGPDAVLVKKKDLSQGGEFLSEQRVRVVTNKGELAHVAVLGPERPAVQVELSRTDCRTLGIQPPVRLSGDLRDAADVYLIGPKGMIFAPGSAIIAKAHIHLPPAEAQRRGLHNGQQVRVRMETSRPLTFEGVEVRVKDTFTPELHLDLDEANACGLEGGSRGVILA